MDGWDIGRDDGLDIAGDGLDIGRDGLDVGRDGWDIGRDDGGAFMSVTVVFF